MIIDLRGRVSIVTGGARGIGGAIADALAEAGSRVVVFDLDAGSPEMHSCRVDMRDANAIREACEAVVQEFGAIDHLVNNAGIQHVAPLADFPDDRWEAVRAIDLDGVFHATKAVWPHLVARGRGRIVNVASVHGLVASEFKAAYVAAKHGVVGLTKVAALEGARHGITVNAVCPGAVLTDLVRNQAPQLAESYGGGISEEAALERAFLQAMPARRFIEPQEVASLCVYLCSDHARSITGSPISIDGGWTAH